MQFVYFVGNVSNGGNYTSKIMINSLDYHDDNFKFDNYLCVTNEETHFIFYYLPLF